MYHKFCFFPKRNPYLLITFLFNQPILCSIKHQCKTTRILKKSNKFSDLKLKASKPLMSSFEKCLKNYKLFNYFWINFCQSTYQLMTYHAYFNMHDKFILSHILICMILKENIGQWCIVNYDNDPYPGIILEVEDDIRVKCMHRNGTNKFYWPCPPDDISWYRDDQIVCLIREPQTLNKRSGQLEKAVWTFLEQHLGSWQRN